MDPSPLCPPWAAPQAADRRFHALTPPPAAVPSHGLSDRGPRGGGTAPGCLTSRMSVEDDYEPSPRSWVREQVALYEESGGTQGTTLRDTGLPVVIITNRGVRSGKLRKTPVMRVEHDGRYAAVASQGGSPAHPQWYYNFRANPAVRLQDGPHHRDMIAREVTGEERARWWERAVAAYPPYAEYQQKTTRQIPVFVLEPADGH